MKDDDDDDDGDDDDDDGNDDDDDDGISQDLEPRSIPASIFKFLKSLGFHHFLLSSIELSVHLYMPLLIFT